MMRLYLRALVVCLCLSTLMSDQVQADQYVVVVLDDSGSMKDSMGTRRKLGRRIDAAKRALESVLSRLDEDTQVGVLALNSKYQGSHWIVPIGSADPDRWRARLTAIKAEGGTLLGEFIRQGADELLKQRALHRYGTYRLLVVTDGEANDAQVLASILPDVVSRGLVLDVIGVDMAGDHSLAARAHSYRRADDENSLEQAITEVFAETSDQSSDTVADFEMLAALPDEFAVEGLKALAQSVRNEPIANSASDTPENSSIPNAPSSSTVGGTSVNFVLGLVCCLGTFIGLVFFVILLASLGFSFQRKRR